MAFYRQIGDQNSGGYQQKWTLWAMIAMPLWRWRLGQALRIAGMSRQPVVIQALHKALREHTPAYLDDWRRTQNEVGAAVDDLHDLMQWLRDEGHYAQADRLRTIMARVAKSVPPDCTAAPGLIRDIARTFK